MRVRSLPDALRIATPKKRLLGAGGGFLTRPVTYGVAGTGTDASVSAAAIFGSLANDMFNGKPNKVSPTFEIV
jgi:hypothetical protein